ncbi:unnamed protein product [marine sediment metagenome]|uniref:Uncharacterized protein n=1 Tax=marine sediment metagenome TaxID=412755 RepID=X0RU42_9ZZZZ
MSDEDWRDQLPEELQEAPYFKSAESIDQVLSDLTNAAQLQGNAIRRPDDDATEEDIDAFREKIAPWLPGPVEPEVIQAEALTEFPDDASEEMQAYAKELGLTESQFIKLRDRAEAETEINAETMAAHKQNTRDSLRQLWDYDLDHRTQQVATFLNTPGTPTALIASYENGSIDAATMVWLHALSEQGLEESQMAGQLGAGASNTNPQEEKKALMKALIALTPGTPEHTRTHNTLNALLLRIGPRRKRA